MRVNVDVHLVASRGVERVRIRGLVPFQGWGSLRLECRSARLDDRQAVPQAGETQEHSSRRTDWHDDRKPPPTPSELVLKVDERAEPARVDEADLAEIDDNGPGGLARRVL
jgi:hypothetical protein